MKQSESPYQPLFNLMSEHGLTLLEGEMDEIINCVHELDRTPTLPVGIKTAEEYKNQEWLWYAKFDTGWDLCPLEGKRKEQAYELAKREFEIVYTNNIEPYRLSQKEGELREENERLKAENKIYTDRALKLSNRYGNVKFTDEFQKPHTDYVRGYLQGLTEATSIINP